MQHRFFVGIMLLCGIAYLCFVGWTCFNYFTCVSIANGDDLSAWGDKFPNYWEFWYANWVVTFGGLYLVLGCTFLFVRSRIKKTLIALLIMLLPLISIYRVSGTTETTETLPSIQAAKPAEVNVLIYFDEECVDEATRHLFYDVLFHGIPKVYDPYQAFSETFQIFFYPLNSYNDFWNSTDVFYRCDMLLQEAIKELGGVWDPENLWWVWKPKPYIKNGWPFIADFLCVFTGQDMDKDGFSPPMWNATILRFDVGWNVIIHELSHQFWVRHCSNICVMNPAWTAMCPTWCGDCTKVIDSNRAKWGYKQWFYIETPSGGSVTPPDNVWYQSPNGTNIIIQAFPKEGYRFVKWWFYNPDNFGYIRSSTQNPFTFSLHGNYYIVAEFCWALGPGCWGNGGGGFHYLR